MKLKRTMALVLTVVMLISMVPLNVLGITASAETTEDYTYTVENGEATITDYTGAGGDLTIPATLGGYPVTSIGSYAFEDCSNLASVTIPGSVTSIGDAAFISCSDLARIVVDSGNEYYSSDETGVLFNKDKTALIQYPAGNAATEYIIPGSVTDIGYYAFYYCSSLTGVTIPGSVTSIGDSAFKICYRLSDVYYMGTSALWDEISIDEGNSYLTNATFHFICDQEAPDAADYEYTIENNKTTITGYTGAGGDLTIPSTLGGYPVTRIGSYAFEDCSSLTGVTIPNSVTSIGRSAFYRCDSLVSIIVDSGNEYYSNDEAGVLFNKDKTTLIQYPAGNTSTEYIISNSVTSIEYAAFYNCDSLTSVTIPDGVIEISAKVFYSCDSLTSVTIPVSVTSVGSEAFGNCDSLTSIIVDSGNEYYSSDETGVLFNKDKTTLIQYSVGNTATEYIIPDSVTSINLGTFYDCDNLTEITIPDSVTSINTGTFYDCDNLTEITIPDSVTTIGESAFRGCSSLTEITIPDSVTTIGESAFYDCGSLTKITIPDSVTAIGGTAFADCDNLTYVTIGNGVTSITISTFFGCTNLTNVTIGNSVTTIDERAFYNCDNLTDIYYAGDQAQWDTISIGDYNDAVKDANFWFNHPAEHIFSDYVSNNDATCTADGTKTAKCDRCDAKDTVADVGSKLGHKYSNTWDTTCSHCGGTRSVSLSNTVPKLFKASLVGNDDVKLTWKAGKGANRYYVYYRRAGKTDWKRAGITTGLTYTIKDLVANGKYEFKVISYLKDSSGTYKGASTKVLTYSTTRNLKAPSKVTLKLYGYDDVQISWSKVSYAVGYKVYYKRSTSKSYSYIGFTTGRSIKKANLSDGVKYTFKVVPCTKVNGDYFADDSSKTATVTTLKTVSTPKVTKSTSTKVKVSWTDIAGESGYQIVVTSDKAGKKVITSTATTGKSKVVSAKKGKTYYYKVRAYKTVDGKKIYAPWSAVKSYKLK